MKNKLIIAFFLLTFYLSAQESNYLQIIEPFDVLKNDLPFNNTFCGGLNNPEFQFVDIDADDDYDLFILNSDASFIWFENIGDKFSYSYTYSLDSLTGIKVKDWFYFVDIDADEDVDLFTGQKGSKVKFFENIGNSSNPSFELRIDTVRNVAHNDVNVEAGSNPAFVDIDNDGDYDLVSGNTSGTANFYRNIGTPNQFLFDSLDSEWQNLRVVGGKLNLIQHGASSIEFADIDKDKDYDLFWGDLFNTSLYLIRNIGTPTEPKMEIETRVYPHSADSISTKGYNMPRFVDIDSDGDLDLFNSVLWNDLSIKETISFRRNYGSNEFGLVTTNFLNTIDVGSRSTPDLVDIDSDGDLDLFVGAESIIGDGTIYFFENTGTSTQPVFELKETTFADIKTTQIAVPSFGDIDNDGDLDLIVAEFSNNILLYENVGDKFIPNFTFTQILETTDNQSIKAGVYPRARLVDVDGDNDLDIIVGNFNGEVILYRNVGDASNYLFERDNEYINISKPGNYTVPNIYDYDNDGINELFIGTNDGEILLYESGSNQKPEFLLQDQSFLNTNLGAEPNITFADIDSDGDDDVIIGSIKGGLFFFQNQTILDVKSEPINENFNLSIKAYPNPFNNTVQIEMYIPQNLYFSLKIFNILGEEVTLLQNGISKGGIQRFEWNTNNLGTNLSSGIYILSIQTKIGLKSLPIVYLK